MGSSRLTVALPLLQDFNQPIDWDVSHVTSMVGTFKNATSFNQKSVKNWNVSNVCDFTSMFDGASSFKQDLSSWLPSIQETTCPSTPVVTNFLKGTACPNTSDPVLPDGPICKVAAKDNSCLKKTIKTLDCQCKQRNQCLQKLRHACRAEMKALGMDEAALRQEAKKVLKTKCR